MNTIHKEKIEYHEEKIRDTVCPITSALYDDNKYERCRTCDYFKEGYCVTKDYITKIKQQSELEGQDPCGGMPVTDYQWEFSCGYCGKKMQYHSGMSNIGHQTMIRCKECNTPHVLMEGGYSDATFIIPDK